MTIQSGHSAMRTAGLAQAPGGPRRKFATPMQGYHDCPVIDTPGSPCLASIRDGLLLFVERLSACVAVCAPRGRILHVNPPLRRLLRVVPSNAELAESITRAAAGLAERGASAAAMGGTFSARLHATRIGPRQVGPGGALIAVLVDPVAAPGELQGTLQGRFGLTTREAEVAVLLARGLSTKAIALDLDISWHTARGHVERAMRKLDVRSRSRAAAVVAEVASDGGRWP